MARSRWQRAPAALLLCLALVVVYFSGGVSGSWPKEKEEHERDKHPEQAAVAYERQKQDQDGRQTELRETGARAAPECLWIHNKLRYLHGTPDLEWDDQLAEFARGRSADMAVNNKFQHEPGTPFGENLAWFGDTRTHCKTMVKAWYGEHDKYSYSTPGFSHETGHFTQLVWRASTRIGCATALGSLGIYLTCNYDPPGNLLGAFEENVPPRWCERGLRCEIDDFAGADDTNDDTNGANDDPDDDDDQKTHDDEKEESASDEEKATEGEHEFGEPLEETSAGELPSESSA